MKYILIFFLFLINIHSCEEKSKKRTKGITNKGTIVENEIYLDKLLKCDKVDIRNGHYRIPDNGCLYSPNYDNRFGNADVVLFPITDNFDTDNIEKRCNGDIDCLKEVYSEINSFNIIETKKNFNAIIFLIKKNNLKKNSKSDQSYTPTIPYEVITYILKDKKWENGNTYIVKDDESHLNENTWRDNYIDSLAQAFNYKSTSKKDNLKTSISKKWIGNYSSYFKYKDSEGNGWELNITVDKDSIFASGDGYQMGFKDVLTSEDLGDKLVLYHKHNLYGYKLGSSMKPEFIITKKGDSYFILSGWISDIEETPTNIGYKLNKIE